MVDRGEKGHEHSSTWGGGGRGEGLEGRAKEAEEDTYEEGKKMEPGP